MGDPGTHDRRRRVSLSRRRTPSEGEEPTVRDASPAVLLETTAVATTRLLAVILGSATLPLLQRLHTERIGLRQLGRAFPDDLRRLGFHRRHLEKLRAVFEIARRYGEEEFVPGTPFRSSQDVYAHFREQMGEAVREEFVAVLLDQKHCKITDVTVSIGSLSASVVHPRDVYAQVIRHSAAAVIFVHNHPSGDPTPSPDDLALTRRLREVGELVGVRVLDHVIIGKGRYVSFVDDGYW